MCVHVVHGWGRHMGGHVVVRASEQSQLGDPEDSGWRKRRWELEDGQIPLLHAVCSRSNLKTQHGPIQLGDRHVCVTAVASMELEQAAAHTSCWFPYLCHLQ